MTTGLESSCLVCGTPLTGVLGATGRIAGIRRSPQNPNLCSRCDAHVQDGRIVEVAVLFADLTRFTPLTAELGPERTHELVDAFLRMAKRVVVKWDGFVVQFAGDQIMALFNVPLLREDYRRRAVAAAGEIQRGMAELEARFARSLQVTIGVAAGHARVGRLGSEDLRDFTAVGDVVNRAARLVAHVAPGGILVDADIFSGVRDEFPEVLPERVPLKGFDSPVEVVSLGGRAVLRDASPQRVSGRRPLRAAMLLSAILGAPCAGLVVLSPLMVAFGAGAASFGAAAAVLDQPGVRLPLVALASSAALANLAVIVRRRRSEAPGDEIAAAWTAARSPGHAGWAVSVATLAVVAFELVAHELMH